MPTRIGVAIFTVDNDQELGEDANELEVIDGYPALNFPNHTLTIPPFLSHSRALELLPRPPSSSSSPPPPSLILHPLLNDCRRAHRAKTDPTDPAYNHNHSFFLAADAAPRCLLEELIRDVFLAHAPEENRYDPSISGAEWWTHVFPSPATTTTTSPSDAGARPRRDGDGAAEQEEGEVEEDDEDDTGQGLRWVADGALRPLSPSLVHPQIATITYLSCGGTDGGGTGGYPPTLVMDKRSPPPTFPPSVTSVDSYITQQSKACGGLLEVAYLSHEMAGKHVAFDGRLLHGVLTAEDCAVPAVPSPTTGGSRKRKLDSNKNDVKSGVIEDGGKRHLLFVNIWLNHAPIESLPILDAVLPDMTPLSSSSRDGGSDEGSASAPPLYRWNADDNHKLTSVDDLDTVKLTNGNGGSGGKLTTTTRKQSVMTMGHEITLSFECRQESLTKLSQDVAKTRSKSAKINCTEGGILLAIRRQPSMFQSDNHVYDVDDGGEEDDEEEDEDEGDEDEEEDDEEGFDDEYDDDEDDNGEDNEN